MQLIQDESHERYLAYMPLVSIVAFGNISLNYWLTVVIGSSSCEAL